MLTLEQNKRGYLPKPDENEEDKEEEEKENGWFPFVNSP